MEAEAKERTGRKSAGGKRRGPEDGYDWIADRTGCDENLVTVDADVDAVARRAARVNIGSMMDGDVRSGQLWGYCSSLRERAVCK